MGGLCSKRSESSTQSVITNNQQDQRRTFRDFQRPVIGKNSFQARASISYFNIHNAVNVLSKDKTAGLKGLQNSGNTCFMNSSLQCLSNTIPLTDYFLGFDYSSEINTENFLGTGGHLANAYAKLMKQMWSQKPNNTKRGHRGIAPDWLRNDLSKYCSHLFTERAYEQTQEDAHEFLAYFLDGIHEDLNRVPSHNKPYIDGLDLPPDTSMEQHAIIAWESYLTRNKSIIVDLFQGQLRNTMTCCKCQYQTIGFDPFMYISLPIANPSSPDPVSLDDCLQLFLSEEHLCGDNAWYCPKCKDHVEATKKFDIWMLPPILIIHLKRFEFNSFQNHKIDTRINYPMSEWKLPLQAGSLNCNENEQKHLNYDLYAIAHHHGHGIGSGHYTAHCKNRFNDNWYHFNDADCKHINSPESLESLPSAYCLFYNRSTGTSNSQNASKIFRQTLSRPDLWPHMQVSLKIPEEEKDEEVIEQCTSNNIDTTNREECFRSFVRKS